MNRLFKTVHTVLVILFVFINLYFLAFNWNIFTVSLNVSYGFGSFNVPPFIFLLFVNLSIILIVWFTEYTKDLRGENSLLKKQEEISLLKNGGGVTSSASIETSLVEIQKQIAELSEMVHSQQAKDGKK
jgi:hypothetical protein